MTLVRKHWFGIAAGALLMISAANIGRYHKRTLALATGVFRRDVLVDTSRWQGWAGNNRGFFAPLSPGVCLALVREPSDYAATMLMKTPNGIRAERTNFLRPHRCLVVFAMDEPTAQKILSLRADQGNPFWDAWKHFAHRDALRVYTVGSREELKASGVAAFLAAIDVRPDQRRR